MSVSGTPRGSAGGVAACSGGISHQESRICGVCTQLVRPLADLPCSRHCLLTTRYRSSPQTKEGLACFSLKCFVKYSETQLSPSISSGPQRVGVGPRPTARGLDPEGFDRQCCPCRVSPCVKSARLDDVPLPLRGFGPGVAVAPLGFRLLVELPLGGFSFPVPEVEPRGSLSKGML